jgi:hypothetical protein
VILASLNEGSLRWLVSVSLFHWQVPCDFLPHTYCDRDKQIWLILRLRLRLLKLHVLPRDPCQGLATRFVQLGIVVPEESSIDATLYL